MVRRNDDYGAARDIHHRNNVTRAHNLAL